MGQVAVPSPADEASQQLWAPVAEDAHALASAGAASPQPAWLPAPPGPRRNPGKTNANPRGLSFFALLREDLRTHDGDWLEQGFWAVAVHRFGNWRMDLPALLRWPASRIYGLLYKIVEWTCGISLPYTVNLGRRVRIWHHGGMILNAAAIGDDVHIRQNTTFGIVRRSELYYLPIIEDRCDLAAGVVAMGSITIGHDSVIGANAVVTKDVPPFSVAVGVPAKVIRTHHGNAGAARSAAPDSSTARN